MRAVYYARVSTGSQSLERQISDIEKYCRKEDIEIVTGFREVESGKVKVRPVLTELETYLNTNKVDFLIISELSRLGRTSKVIETIENLNLKKIGLISLKEALTTINPDGSINQSSKLIIEILSSINSFELDTTKYRSLSGIEQSIRAGRAGGSLNFPYGYTKIGLKKESKLVRDTEEAEIIKRIFNLYLEGNGTGKIATILNDDNIPTRTNKIIQQSNNTKYYKYKDKWVNGTIYSILINPIYTGKRRRKNKEVTIAGRKTKKVEYELLDFPDLRIISDDTFNKVQNLLKSNFNKTDKHIKNEYLLEPRKIICGICGKTYFAHKRTSGKNIGKDNTYKCLSRRYNENCGNVGISISKIEYFIQQIVLFLFEDKLVERLDDKSLKLKIDDLTIEITDLRNQLEKIKTKGSLLYEDRLNGFIPIDLFVSKNEELKKQETDLITKLDIKLQTKFDLNETYSNLKDIKKLKMNFYKGTKIPKDVVNKIISKITLKVTDDYPKDVFRERGTVTTKNRKTKQLVTRELKKDNIIEMKILSADLEYKFLISQLTNEILYYFNENEDPISLTMFFVDKKEPEVKVEDRMNRIKSFYEVIIDRK